MISVNNPLVHTGYHEAKVKVWDVFFESFIAKECPDSWFVMTCPDDGWARWCRMCVYAHGMERGNHERDMRVYKRGKRRKRGVGKVLVVIWEVSTASRTYARMGWDDDDG